MKLAARRWKLEYVSKVACAKVVSKSVTGVVRGGCQSSKLVIDVGHVKMVIKVCRNLVAIVTNSGQWVEQLKILEEGRIGENYGELR